ncbi:hypothetical protein [Burkholderia ambifaria]|uniref:hypothetical protein n=1 Tax=Burkholderia ambifaria TaxID=152480 RepID=UPI000F7FFF90|nr:hypothetical protein [Burkholderia ambifaria]
MARLSPEKKLANRELFKARDRAFRARREQWSSARDAALATFDAVSQEQRVYQEADEAFEAARRQREDARRELERQMELLKEQLAGLDARHNLTELAEVRRRAVDARNAARSAVEKRVEQDFQDVAHVYSAVEWAANGHFEPPLA